MCSIPPDLQVLSTLAGNYCNVTGNFESGYSYPLRPNIEFPEKCCRSCREELKFRYEKEQVMSCPPKLPAVCAAGIHSVSQGRRQTSRNEGLRATGAILWRSEHTPCKQLWQPLMQTLSSGQRTSRAHCTAWFIMETGQVETLSAKTTDGMTRKPATKRILLWPTIMKQPQNQDFCGKSEHFHPFIHKS